MKDIVDSKGKIVQVSLDTPTKMVNGKRVLLTDDEILIKNVEEVQYLDQVAKEKYKRDRKNEYGSIETQLDMIYWDKVNNTNTFVDHITAIKNKYPKPTK